MCDHLGALLPLFLLHDTMSVYCIDTSFHNRHLEMAIGEGKMALLDAWLYVDFQDAPGKISTQRYLLAEQYDTATPASMGDVVTNASAAITEINVLTMDKVAEHRICLAVPGTGAAPNVTANNQVMAFSRVIDADGLPFGFTIPAWDDPVFSQDQNNMLSAAYNTAAEALAQLIVNPNNPGTIGQSVPWSQSRGRKTRHVPLG